MSDFYYSELENVAKSNLESIIKIVDPLRAPKVIVTLVQDEGKAKAPPSDAPSVVVHERVLCDGEMFLDLP